jgi:hypothetical protein
MPREPRLLRPVEGRSGRQVLSCRREPRPQRHFDARAHVALAAGG